MASKNIILAATFGAFLALSACKKDDPTTYDCNGVTSTYTTNVKPIMDSKCATSGCHDAITAEKGYDLSSYTSTKTASGNAAFMGSMEHQSAYEAMPQGMSKLTDAELQLIGCWIQNGTPE